MNYIRAVAGLWCVDCNRFARGTWQELEGTAPTPKTVGANYAGQTVVLPDAGGNADPALLPRKTGGTLTYRRVGFLAWGRRLA